MNKIVHVITNFSGVGGAELMLIRLINATPKNNHKIISLMGISKELKERVENENVEYKALGCTNIFSMFFSFLILRGILRGKENVLIIAWMYHACVISGLASLFTDRINIFFNIRHSLDALRNEKISTRLAIFFTKLLSYSSDGVIYCSNNAKLQHENYGFSKDKSIYIPNGFSFKKENNKNESDNKKEFIIGMLGRYNEAKDFYNLIKAFNNVQTNIPNVRLKIGGKGVDYNNIELLDLIDKQGIPRAKVELLGPVKDVDNFYKSLDLYVLSSRNEAFPNVLVEAMSNSLPVISTNVGDASLIIDNHEFLVPPSDSDSLASKILFITSMTEERRREIGLINRDVVTESYDIKFVSKRYLELAKWKVN
ncbi:glycosyltransferase [Vibrio gigantis]